MSRNMAVTVADILELRGDGVSEEEVWSLLCQAVQTLQDLFLSDEINQGNILPVVTPQNLEIGSKGRVTISYLSDVHEEDKEYLSPEYRNGVEGESCHFDWEKMWVFSLGKALQSSLKLSPGNRSTSLGLVLEFMTKENPSERASLMSLLNVISEHCKTNLPSKPFSHLVMDMYREVFGTPTQCLSPPTSLKREESTSSLFESKSPFIIHQRPIKKSLTDVKRNPVQRAPSRLYRGPAKQSESKNDNGTPQDVCVGPEFVVRGTEPPRTVHIGDKKGAQRRTVIVALLTGVRIQVTCDPQTITAGKVFEVVAQLEQLEDNYIFGLASMMNGDFVFIPPEMKLHKLAPTGWKDVKNDRKLRNRTWNFLLFVRVKFFLPNLRGVRNWTTKHLLYLQLRRSLIEQQIKCDLKELLSLGGLALQAEFGNYLEQEHGSSAYFLLEHYLPEDLIDERFELERQLQELHKSRCGLDPRRAEEIFIAQAQRLPEYGSHHYTAEWVRKSVKIPMWVTINPQGVYLYEKKKSILDRKIHEAFTWRNIQSLKCNEQYFHIVPHSIGKQKLTSYKLWMDSKKSFFFFRLASYHHQFFLKLRVELSSLHSLSLEFGVPIAKKEAEEKENRKNLSQERMKRNERKITYSEGADQGHQNKENENPTEAKKEKRKGVKMGVRAFQRREDIGRRLSVSTEASNSSSDAYVLDSSIKSCDETFTYDLQDTLPSALADRFSNISWENERMLRKVRLSKDKYGSFGLEVVEGENGGVFVENVLKTNADDEIQAVRKGDQLISVNGLCLLNVNYAEALNLLRNAGDEMEILVSQSCKKEVKQKPVEYEYLRNIRYDTALETDNYESKIVVKNVPALDGQGGLQPFAAEAPFILCDDRHLYVDYSGPGNNLRRDNKQTSGDFVYKAGRDARNVNTKRSDPGTSELIKMNCATYMRRDESTADYFPLVQSGIKDPARSRGAKQIV